MTTRPPRFLTRLSRFSKTVCLASLPLAVLSVNAMTRVVHAQTHPWSQTLTKLETLPEVDGDSQVNAVQIEGLTNLNGLNQQSGQLFHMTRLPVVDDVSVERIHESANVPGVTEAVGSFANGNARSGEVSSQFTVAPNADDNGNSAAGVGVQLTDDPMYLLNMQRVPVVVDRPSLRADGSVLNMAPGAIPTSEHVPTTVRLSSPVGQEQKSTVDHSTQQTDLSPGTQAMPGPGEVSMDDVSAIQVESVIGFEKTKQVSLNEILANAIRRSNQIKQFQFAALEFQQVAGREYGQFDPVGFMESSFGQGEEPVSTNFQVGNAAQRIIDSQDLQYRSGFRKRTQAGGNLSVANTFQFFDDNSGVLLPPDQAISRFELNFSQELLRDSGKKVVLNRVLVADAIAQGETANNLAQIVNHLNRVAAAYWDLFVDRGKVLISKEQVELGEFLVEKIGKRVEFDGEKNLAFQAKSTLLQREVELKQALAQAKQSQDFLARLIGDESLMDPNLELITTEMPILEILPIDIESEIAQAYANRAEIQQSLANIKAAKLNQHLTLNQLLPRLTLELQASLAGLAGDQDLGASFEQQFDAPSYQAGFNFEVPLRNRSARFQNRQAELAASRVAAEFRNTLDGIQLEVKLASRRLNYVGAALETLVEVINNTYQELDIIEDRTLVAPKRGDIPAVQLNLLLDAQARLNNAKLEFLDSMLEQQQAVLELKRATGTLYNECILYPDKGPGRYRCHRVKKQVKCENGEYRPEMRRVKQKINCQTNCFNGKPTIASPRAGGPEIRQPTPPRF